MSTPQEYWDACLIKTWRNAGMVMDAAVMFKAVTGTEIKDAQLLRAPRAGYPFKTGMRAFVASYLPKISDRLWNQQPDRDVALLKALSASGYDTLKAAMPQDKEFTAAQAQIRRNHKVINMNGLAASNRNHDTNWNVTKATNARRRAK